MAVSTDQYEGYNLRDICFTEWSHFQRRTTSWQNRTNYRTVFWIVFLVLV